MKMFVLAVEKEKARSYNARQSRPGWKDAVRTVKGSIVVHNAVSQVDLKRKKSSLNR
jgi:hypothetical protein